MAIERHPVSRQAYQEIRTIILSGRFAPGTKLVVRPIAEELGLSPTPVKAALAALEGEGLVAAVPNRGFFVRSFDEASVKDICTFRGAMDRLAAELAASRPEREVLLHELRLNLAQQRVAVIAGDKQCYADLNNAFHEAIWIAAGNRQLAEAAAHLAGQVRLLVNTSVEGPGRPEQSLREHEELLNCLSKGDAQGAGLHALNHAMHSEEILLEVMRSSTRTTA